MGDISDYDRYLLLWLSILLNDFVAWQLLYRLSVDLITVINNHYSTNIQKKQLIIQSSHYCLWHLAHRLAAIFGSESIITILESNSLAGRILEQ